MTIDRASLTPFAMHFIDSYHETAIFSRRFDDDYGIPPTLMTKAHHLRSVIQARLTRDDDFDLRSKFSEFGRVQFADNVGQELVLRSASALAIEHPQPVQNEQLFETESYVTLASTEILIYQFNQFGLSLSTCGARKLPKKTHLYAYGSVTSHGLWPWDDDGGDDGISLGFPQDGPDDFGDIGDIDLGDEEQGDRA